MSEEKSWARRQRVKGEKLGMTFGSATGRLVKDLLYDYVKKAGHNKCHRCGEDISRGEFSIEHKRGWFRNNDPAQDFFDLDNIGFSHKVCNASNGRSATKPYSGCGSVAAYKRGCRCDVCREARSKDRKERYRLTGR